MVWIIGEYAERIDNADDLLAQFLETFPEETAMVGGRGSSFFWGGGGVKGMVTWGGCHGDLGWMRGGGDALVDLTA
jgi:hypothetical protein